VTLFLLSSRAAFKEGRWEKREKANQKDMLMRTVTGMVSALVVAAGLALSSAAALAADDEGKVARVDAEAMTLTLENGNTYKLSGEFDVEALEVGVEVVLAYDTVGGEKLVSDLVIYE
jgi:hypothetical protein